MYFCTVVSIEAQGGDASKRRNTPDVENVGSKTGLRAGDRHIKKALSQRLICGFCELRKFISNRTVRQWSMSMVLCILCRGGVRPVSTIRISK